MTDVRFIRPEILIYPLLTLPIFSCSLPEETTEPVQTEQVIPEAAPETCPGVTPEMVEEYGRIHQISDPKTAEFYLTHPDYAKDHPYTPTAKDIEFHERPFLEKVYPGFKKLAEEKGFMRARAIYMSNPANGPGNRYIGSRKYRDIMQQIASLDGKGASAGTKNALFEEDPAVIHYQEAMKFQREGRLDDAIREMEIALKSKPDAPALLYNLGVMYMEKEDYDKAVQSLRSALEYIKGTGYTKVNLAMYPGVYMGACTNLGVVYTRLGEYNDAVKVLEEAIQFRPDDAGANWSLGAVYWSMGDIKKTIGQMKKCVKLDPNNAAAHNIIGLAYYCDGFYEIALKEFQTAAKLDPSEKQYSYNEALTLARLDRYDEVNQALEKASGLEEGEYLRRVYEEQISVNRAKKLYNDGYAAMQSRDLNQAIERFEAALELRPDMVNAHVNLGVCYRMKGDKDKQIQHFEEAARLKPDMPDVHYNLGLAYSDARMYPEAIVEFRRVTKLKPLSRDAYFNLGTVLYKTGNYADAAAEFGRCVELSPDWFEAHLNLGSCDLKIKNLDGAIDHFQKAIQLKPNSAEAHYDLGAAYVRVRRYDEASALFQKALELDPAHRRARMMLKDLEIYLGR